MMLGNRKGGETPPTLIVERRRLDRVVRQGSQKSVAERHDPAMARRVAPAKRDRIITDFALGATAKDVAQGHCISFDHAVRLQHFHEQQIRERADAFDRATAEKPISDPVQRALDLLPCRAVHRDGRFTLDGRPVGAQEVVRAANRLLRMRKEPPIPYPGVETTDD